MSCTPACALLVDNLAYFLEPAQQHRLYLTPGRVSLAAQFASGLQASRSMTTSAGETARLELKEPKAPAPSSLACGALTLWAAIDTKRQHTEYVEHPSDETWNDGVARQRMTNLLLASTAVLGAATITLTFFVRGSDKTNVGISPALGRPPHRWR